MNRPLILDLFCGAGGAAMGYHRAGFDVFGVDIEPQPDYPFEFHQGDALTLGPEFLRSWRFDAIHASPPCQYFTKGAGQAGTRGRHLNLIPPVRALLKAAGLPYVIENVDEARRELINPILLCGAMFDLGVFRHRWFEAPRLAGPVRGPHLAHAGRVGDGRYFTVTGHSGGRSNRDQVAGGSKADWSRAMGIDWMTTRQLSQAIPPAYTECIGAQLLDHLGAGQVAA